MVTCERIWQGETSGSSGTQDRDSGVAAHDGEQAEHRKNERHRTHSPDQASDANTRLPPQRATDWNVDNERVELSVGPGCVKRFKPSFKLIPAEPSFSRGVS
jgi:hypothetical protein